jgi:hypothetical protein
VNPSREDGNEPLCSSMVTVLVEHDLFITEVRFFCHFIYLTVATL